MKTSEYLDLAQRKTGARNDNQLMKLMKWKPSQINNYRHDRQPMDNEQARQIAEVTEVNIVKVIADMEIIRAERKNNSEAKKAWKELAKMTKQMGGVSTNLLINMNLFFMACGSMYIMLNKRPSYITV